MTILTLQVLAISLDGPYGLLWSIPLTAIALFINHRLLGRPLAHPASTNERPMGEPDETPIREPDERLIFERPIFTFVMVLVGLGTLPAVWATAGWPGAVALILVVIAMAAFSRTQWRR